MAGGTEGLFLWGLKTIILSMREGVGNFLGQQEIEGQWDFWQEYLAF